jgi:hypothetical protein
MNQGRKGLMKRSIYAKTSKPHLPDKKTIHQELAFNDLSCDDEFLAEKND